ncbi:MAG TPA: DUF2461 family protein, partial [Spirochaetota bacterium]
RPSMDAFREIIDTNPARITKIAAAVQKEGYSIEGDSYARAIKELPENLAVWYNRKNLYLMKERKHDEKLFSPAIADEIAKSFKAIAPLYDLLKEAAERGLDQ